MTHKESSDRKELEILQRLEQAKLEGNKIHIKIWSDVLAKIRKIRAKG